MADIAACIDKKCPSRTICYRYTCPKNPFAQTYFVSNRKEDEMRCDKFWEVE